MNLGGQQGEVCHGQEVLGHKECALGRHKLGVGTQGQGLH